MAYQDEIRDQLKLMSGWCDPQKAIALADLVVAERLQSCAEVGVFAGKSLLATAYGLRELGSGLIHAIDSWSNSDCIADENPENKAWWAGMDLEAIYTEFISHLARTGLARYVRVIRASSIEASKLVPSNLDLLHIDGCHSEWSSTSDVTLWLPKVRSGGWVCMDDYNWPSVQTAIKFVRKWCDEVKVINTTESVCAFYKKRVE